MLHTSWGHVLDDSDDWLKLVASTGKGCSARFCSAGINCLRVGNRHQNHSGSSVDSFGEALLADFLACQMA